MQLSSWLLSVKKCFVVEVSSKALKQFRTQPNVIGCTYQSCDSERCTYQSRDPKGYTYQSRDPEGHISRVIPKDTHISRGIPKDTVPPPPPSSNRRRRTTIAGQPEPIATLPAASESHPKSHHSTVAVPFANADRHVKLRRAVSPSSSRLRSPVPRRRSSAPSVSAVTRTRNRPSAASLYCVKPLDPHPYRDPPACRLHARAPTHACAAPSHQLQPCARFEPPAAPAWPLYASSGACTTFDFRRLGERVVTARTCRVISTEREKDRLAVLPADLLHVRWDLSQPERLRYSLGNYQGPACPYGGTCFTCSGTCQFRGRGRGKMPPRRGARRGGGRGGRGAGHGQLEEQPAVPAVDPNAPVTQADLAAMEQCYQDMLQAALTPFLAAQQNQAASCSGPNRHSSNPFGSLAHASSTVG
ncbi:NBS-LRR type resistance protein [Cucumis melo var. makuwa]|uniref:NBS-LRR type resistance protein n=1 Tax=Cucumis melo var. makuwa TaxID=1194695 RepID=A0A5A7USH6_CUCMM|nr:NBS-LRR type resistance protein [Cucumis melo var. makuwa]TYJ97100.1 NBS-LRR type resistance protein [Cucumis melo var. makuwa]